MMRKSLVWLLFLVFLLAGCRDESIISDDPTPPDDNQPGTPVFVAPDYPDDYSPIAAWSQRDRWNLANIHDPTVVFDGTYYYMYGTDASYGNAHVGFGHFPFRRSRDLVNWEFRGMAMRATPAWVKDTLNNMRARVGLQPIENPRFGHWAPVVRRVGNRFRMYYSIIIDNYIATGLPQTPENFDGSWTEHAFIGLMESTDLANNLWIDRGMVIHSVTDRGTNWSRASLNDWSGYFRFNAIDPTFIITPEGQHWLIYGSWHSGIAAVQLNPQTGKPFRLNTIEDFGVRIARRENNDRNRWQALEGPEIMFNEQTGFYYLFLAYDELSIAYNTRVARSRSITGPFLGIDGANITQGANAWPMLTHPYQFRNHSGWVGFAHNAVFKRESTGEWFYVSQARLPPNTGGNPHSNAIMMGHVRRIRWTPDGWPVVMPQRYAAVPDLPIKAQDLVGTWENINFEYRYQVMQTSQIININADGTVTGAMTSRWVFDEANKVLSIGALRLMVERELDWEANPRVPTIVYSGFNPGGRPVWGKKVQ